MRYRCEIAGSTVANHETKNVTIIYGFVKMSNCAYRDESKFK